MLPLKLRRWGRACSRRWREAQLFARAMTFPGRPILAHLIPTRRCNLACRYCNEYDNVSEPVPLPELLKRVDRLAELGVSAITLSGGEPLLHPQVASLVGHARRLGLLCGLITNGYLLSPALVEALNKAGLDYLQLSVDNLVPDKVSSKSWAPLKPKLAYLKQYAAFSVVVNLVLGIGVANPEDAIEIFRQARALGFKTTVGLAHDGRGQLVALSARERAVYERLRAMARFSFADFAAYSQFQRNLVKGQPNQWVCPAGSLYLYVCERGLVHYCSQQRGKPGIPLETFTSADLAREYGRPKPCAAFCTISCVHQTAMLDQLRQQPLECLERWFSPAEGQAALPTGVRLLKWLFLPPRLGGRRPRLTRLATRVALRVLGVR